MTEPGSWIDGTTGLSATARYTVHALVRGLMLMRADDPPEGVAFENVHALAQAHSVEAIVWQAVNGCSDMPDELAQRWASEADLTLYRRLQFDVAREQVVGALIAQGLSCLPLKGAVLASLYPQPGMRSMSDNDILYGYVEPRADGTLHVRGGSREQQERSVREATACAVRVMEGLGYETTHVGEGNADCFARPPGLSFELHRVLIERTLEQRSARMAAYYENPWARALPGDTPGLYRFSLEDDYLYHIAHAYKHYSGGGCGIRHIADEWVLLAAHEATFDWDYVYAELEKLDLGGFEHDLRTLACEALADGGVRADCAGLSGKSEHMLAYLLSSGTYGTSVNRVRNETAEQGGAGSYALRRLFPSRETLVYHYPVLERHRALTPLVMLWRWCKALMHLPRDVWELRTARTVRREGDERS